VLQLVAIRESFLRSFTSVLDYLVYIKFRCPRVEKVSGKSCAKAECAQELDHTV
jgi:hypothetical protein